MLGDEELLKPPYNIENQAHRRAILAELDRVKALGVKPPQNLWEYKVKRLLCTKASVGPLASSEYWRLHLWFASTHSLVANFTCWKYFYAVVNSKYEVD